MNDDQVKKKIRTMDIVLVFMFACVVVFTIVMILTYLRMGGVPDTLIVAVFAFFGFEAGVMGWIKTTKTKLEGMLDGKGDDDPVDQCNDDWPRD